MILYRDLYDSQSHDLTRKFSFHYDLNLAFAIIPVVRCHEFTWNYEEGALPHILYPQGNRMLILKSITKTHTEDQRVFDIQSARRKKSKHHKILLLPAAIL